MASIPESEFSNNASIAPSSSLQNSNNTEQQMVAFQSSSSSSSTPPSLNHNPPSSTSVLSSLLQSRQIRCARQSLFSGSYSFAWEQESSCFSNQHGLVDRYYANLPPLSGDPTSKGHQHKHSQGRHNISVEKHALSDRDSLPGPSSSSITSMGQAQRPVNERESVLESGIIPQSSVTGSSEAQHSVKQVS